MPISHVLPFFWRVNHLRPAASDDLLARKMVKHEKWALIYDANNVQDTAFIVNSSWTRMGFLPCLCPGCLQTRAVTQTMPASCPSVRDPSPPPQFPTPLKITPKEPNPIPPLLHHIMGCNLTYPVLVCFAALHTTRERSASQLPDSFTYLRILTKLLSIHPSQIITSTEVKLYCTRK